MALISYSIQFIVLFFIGCMAVDDSQERLSPVTLSTVDADLATKSLADIKTSPSIDGVALLQIEGQRLQQLSRQVGETNRALEDLLASKLRDINYATVIGELRSEIDSLRLVHISFTLCY